jgi:hypothetical protein
VQNLLKIEQHIKVKVLRDIFSLKQIKDKVGISLLAIGLLAIGLSVIGVLVYWLFGILYYLVLLCTTCLHAFGM